MRNDQITPEIVYQDNHLIAVNKPPGILTQPSGTTRQSMEEIVKRWVKRTCHKPGQVYLHAVHRLDRLASGIVLFARTGKALSRMNTEIRLKRVTRIYHALVEGRPPFTEGTLEHSLRHSRLRARVTTEDDSRSRMSVLTYRTVQELGDRSLLEIVLETGRYHQIRAQFAACGCPIVGDTRYGGSLPNTFGGIALLHKKMIFAHPTLTIPVTIEVSYPMGWLIEGE
ncbi:MAG: RluA family pseudouridine synthase [Desulfomonilia bacterium]